VALHINHIPFIHSIEISYVSLLLSSTWVTIGVIFLHKILVDEDKQRTQYIKIQESEFDIAINM
jgi:hypothetical protein